MSEETGTGRAGSLDRTEWSPALQQLFTDAGAPAHEDELAGLADVLTAFTGRNAADGPQALPQWKRTKRLVPSLLAAKVLLSAAGAAAAGGFAVAAATDSLPRPLQTFAHDVLGAPAPHHAGGSSGTGHDGFPASPGPASRPSSGTKAPSGSHTSVTTGSHGSPAPAAGHPGASPGKGHGQGTSSPSPGGEPSHAGNGHRGGPPTTQPTPSTEAHPGGKNSTHPTGPPSTQPGGPPSQHQGGSPSTHPGGPPSTHPGGPPSTHPGGPPTSHPTGKPSHP